ncbi:MAG: MaoC family dehydratase N-terminal domain-containing protein [Kineosporiaceae bacterium]
MDPALAGRSYPPGEPFVVGREQVRAFARAVGADHPHHHDVAAARAAGYRDVVAPPTFVVVVAQRSDARLVADPAAGIDYSRVVHGEQGFTHHRPVLAGDELLAALHVDAVRSAGGHAMVTTRNEVTTVDGEPVATVVSTIVVRGGDP